jgi:hypothetical protein
MESRRLRRLDWDAVAGILAAVIGLVLHLLHIVAEDVVLSIILVILALILIRDLRREEEDEEETRMIGRVETLVERLVAGSSPPDAILIGPPHLRSESEAFGRRAQGEMTWFNVCLLMFVPQSLFDALLRPAIENPEVDSIQFILDNSERQRWERAVMPKVAECEGRDKVREPYWTDLSEGTSFILTETRPRGEMEAHISFWGEPFMSRAPGRNIPRYIFHVQSHSELIGRLVDLGRQYRVRDDTQMGEVADAHSDRPAVADDPARD